MPTATPTQAEQDEAVSQRDSASRGKKALVKATESETLRVKSELDAQPRFKVRLFQTPAGRGEKLPNKTVSVNGYSYRITRGLVASVPQSVYEVLVYIGEVDPMEEEFQSLINDTSEAEQYVMAS